jgi:acyl-CoA synthetase (AMP-forming)/AMP-acid ligase II
VVVNVNPLYTPRELEHQLKDSGAKAIVLPGELRRDPGQVEATAEVDQAGGVAAAMGTCWAA